MGEGTPLAHNYTLLDISRTAFAVLLFAIFLLPPGYCFGWATDLLRFRSRSTREQLLFSIPFSIVVSNILANILGRYLNPNVVLAIFLLLALAALLAKLCHRRSASIRRQWKINMPTAICVLMAIVWTTAVIFADIDLQFGRRLYTSTAIWDHAVRIAFIHSAIRHGVPPANPFCYLGEFTPARYYYYWNVLCSYPARLANINPRYVFYASSVWAGFSLAALIPIYLKDFIGVTRSIERKSMIAVLLLSVTGLDILPTVYEFLRAGNVYEDMEWWDPVQVTSWQDALIWVPHHVAALVSFLIGFLALWSVRKNEAAAEPQDAAKIGWAIVFAALAFAAGAGLSVYVAFTFAAFLLIWGMRFLLLRNLRDFSVYLSTGILTFLISIPYLHDLMPASAHAASAGVAGKTGGFVAFGVRTLPSFLSTPYWLKQHGFVHPAALTPFGVIAVYLLEFGFFALVGLSRLKRDIKSSSKRKNSEIASWYMIVIGMFVITFLHSVVITNNDLAYRSAMIVQFILLLWGAIYIDEWIFHEDRRSNPWSLKTAVLSSTLALGFVGTLYSLFILRSYTYLDDRGWLRHPAAWLPASPDIGSETFALRQMYAELNKRIPAKSIIQYNPMAADGNSLLIYDPFQSVDAFPDCGTAFGGDIAKCMPVQAELAQLFDGGGSQNIHDLCRRLSIDVLIAQKDDSAWRDKSSWVWSNAPLYENDSVRAFRCR